MGWLIFFGIIALIFYFAVIVPIQAAGNALGAAQDRSRRQLSLQSIDPKRGRVKVKLNSYGTVEVEGYDRNSKLVSVGWNKDALLERMFRRELEHAEWRMRFISELNYTDKCQWENVLDASWRAIRVLEERDRVVGTLFSEEQTKAITQFADQALVSLHYKSTHADNQALCDEIFRELRQAEEDYEQTEDEIQRRSISTAIKTHQRRLKKQKSVEKTLHLVDSELKSLEATLKLVVEGIRSEISSHHLSGNPRVSPYDSALLELELPRMDEI